MKYAELYGGIAQLEEERMRIVGKYNRLRKENNYTDEDRLINQYIDEVAPIYWKLSGLWRKAPEGFRAYYRAKRGRSHKPL